ncbi:hypothetical protein BDW71DRAFT_195811 [Aspergillus fruticulosus]
MATQWFTDGTLPPPPGIEPNFDDPPSQLFTRLRVLRTKLGMDDLFCVLAYCLTLTFTGLMSYCFSRGIGRHMWDVPMAWLTRTLKYFTIAQYIYLLLTAAIKLAFLFFFYRIFPRHLNIRFFIGFGVVFVAVSHLALFFLTVFSCSPVSHAWDAASPGHCWNPRILPYTSGALSSATALLVFSLGVFAFAASLVRLGMTQVLTSSQDATWNVSRISRWALTMLTSSMIEANTGIICACLPVFPALLDRYRSKDFGSALYRLWSSGSGRKPSSAAAESELSLQQRSWRYAKAPNHELQVV